MTEPATAIKKRWTDSTTVIWAMMGLVGFLLSALGGLGYNVLAEKTNENAAGIKALRDLMDRQIKEINEAQSRHLQDPGIHHAGMNRIAEKLIQINDGVEDIKTNQRAMYLEQQELKVEVRLLKNKERNP